MALAAIFESLGLLSNLKNLLNGVDLSISVSAFPHFEFLHSSYHSFVRLLLSTFVPADELISMGFLR